MAYGRRIVAAGWRVRVAELLLTALVALLDVPATARAQKYTGPDGRLRVALAKQPFSRNGISRGPETMANGGIQRALADVGAHVRVEQQAAWGPRWRSPPT